MRLFVASVAIFISGCLYYDTGAVGLQSSADSGRPDQRAQFDAADVDNFDADATCVGADCCIPESDLEICQRLVLDCGAITAQDNCGLERMVACGVCTPPAECGGGGTPNVCACPEQSDAEFCEILAECGPATGIDSCGQMRTVDCGACIEPETCGGAGQAGICGCSAESDVVFCSRQSACGLLSSEDNCGQPRSADCGACAANEQCTANRCECAPESDTEFCLRLNACGPLSAIDNCGAARNVDCGGCPDNAVCTAGQCACDAEDDQTFCTRLGAVCGELTGFDNCADPRTVANCGNCSMGESCSSNACLVAFPPPGLSVWLRSDSGVTATAQGRVTSWDDRLTGEAWTAPSNNSRPTRLTGHAGHDALRFYGGQTLTKSGAPISTTTFTIYVVGFRAADPDEGAILSVAGGSTLGDHELNFGSTPTTMRFASDNGLAFSATVLDTSSTQALTFLADGASFEFYQNGTQTAATPHSPATPFEFDGIGRFRYERAFEGDLQEVLIWERALTPDERSSVLGYLTARYSL